VDDAAQDAAAKDLPSRIDRSDAPKRDPVSLHRFSIPQTPDDLCQIVFHATRLLENNDACPVAPILFSKRNEINQRHTSGSLSAFGVLPSAWLQDFLLTPQTTHRRFDSTSRRDIWGSVLPAGNEETRPIS